MALYSRHSSRPPPPAAGASSRPAARCGARCAPADPELRRRRSDRRSSHDAAEIERRVSQVRIIDPHHPLYGSCLPVSGRRSGRGPDLIVVRLPDGRERSIPRVATDLSPGLEASPQASDRQMHISVRTLLPLANHVRAMLASGNGDFEGRALPDRTPSQPEKIGADEIPSGGVSPVAPTPGGEAAPTGSACRPASPTLATGGTPGVGDASC